MTSRRIDDDRVLTFKDLKNIYRWPFSDDWTRQLIKEGKFPKPSKSGKGGKGLNLWLKSEIDAYIRERFRQS